MRVFESIFRHVANFLLEASLVVLACMTIYEEIKGPNDSLGKGFVIFFTIIQIIVFILMMIGLVIDILRFCYLKWKESQQRQNKIHSQQ